MFSSSVIASQRHLPRWGRQKIIKPHSRDCFSLSATQTSLPFYGRVFRWGRQKIIKPHRRGELCSPTESRLYGRYKCLPYKKQHFRCRGALVCSPVKCVVTVSLFRDVVGAVPYNSDLEVCRRGGHRPPKSLPCLKGNSPFYGRVFRWGRLKNGWLSPPTPQSLAYLPLCCLQPIAFRKLWVTSKRYQPFLAASKHSNIICPCSSVTILQEKIISYFALSFI